MDLHPKESESATGVLEKTASTSSDANAAAPFEVPDGGFVAWRTVAGAWLVLFGTFGYAYTFGVYEDYYVRVFLPKHSPSSIAWIGSFQLMMPFLLGPIAGKIFDDGGFYMLEAVGCTIFTLSCAAFLLLQTPDPSANLHLSSSSVFMLSLCKPGQYYQVFLAQAVGMGIGLGLTFLPTISIVVHHFKRHRGLTSGIVMSGSSIGATVFPISAKIFFRTVSPRANHFFHATSHLLPRFGFAKTIRYSGAIVPPVLVLGNLMMRTRLPPRSKRGGNAAPPNIKSFFSDAPYMIAILGMFLGLLGLYFPLIYIQLFSVQHSVDSTLAFYSLSILNAAGAFVRVLGNHWADIWGPFNVQVGCSVGAGAIIWAMLGIHNGGSLVVISILYGAFSSAYLALAFACFASLAKGPEEVGARAGLALALCSIGTLVSAPIQGALLTDSYHWIRPVAFSATMTFVSGALFFVTRTLHTRVTGSWRA
ncbi:MFS general substrate transporter [Mycena venus]|uniref:MFS general substrate transporter n=1 Tax=Mycena venus TaxID=2733690 RepID=A0A8H7CR45_9AGAR|nr:MFS general substrate transporter [Mycena venus]